MIRIRTPSRLHLTLIDLNGSIGRVDGGVGITLEEPFIDITADKSDAIKVIGEHDIKERMRKTCETLSPDKGVTIRIDNAYWNHIGLGSGTQAALAAGTAVSTLYGLGLTTRDIAFRTGRGGTSGIGVAAFDHGGFILDGGHRMAAKNGFTPSAYSKGVPPAPLLMRHPFPSWDIVLAIPPTKGAYDVYEKDMFQRLCPIPLAEVEKLSHVILMQMLPAVVEADMETFGRALNTIQDIGFKRREIELQKGSRELIEVMRESGAAGAGMSSFGPTCFAITDSPKKVEAAVEKYMPECTLIRTRARNSGAEITRA